MIIRNSILNAQESDLGIFFQPNFTLLEALKLNTYSLLNALLWNIIYILMEPEEGGFDPE